MNKEYRCMLNFIPNGQGSLIFLTGVGLVIDSPLHTFIYLFSGPAILLEFFQGLCQQMRWKKMWPIEKTSTFSVKCCELDYFSGERHWVFVYWAGKPHWVWEVVFHLRRMPIPYSWVLYKKSAG